MLSGKFARKMALMPTVVCMLSRIGVMPHAGFATLWGGSEQATDGVEAPHTMFHEIVLDGAISARWIRDDQTYKGSDSFVDFFPCKPDRHSSPKLKPSFSLSISSTICSRSHVFLSFAIRLCGCFEILCCSRSSVPEYTCYL